jgi:hypothetical protein
MEMMAEIDAHREKMIASHEWTMAKQAQLTSCRRQS